MPRKAQHAEAKRRRSRTLLGEGPGRTFSVPAIFRSATRRCTDPLGARVSWTSAARRRLGRPAHSGSDRRRLESGASVGSHDVADGGHWTLSNARDGRRRPRATSELRRSRRAATSGHGPCKSARRARVPRRMPTTTGVDVRSGEWGRELDIERADWRANSHFRTVRRATEADAAVRSSGRAVNGSIVDGAGG